MLTDPLPNSCPPESLSKLPTTFAVKSRFSSTLGLAALTLVLLCTRDSGARDRAPRLTKADRELFAWFDTLGFEDPSKARLIRVVFGIAYDFGEPEPRGFLVSVKEGVFRVRLGNLTAAELKRSGTNPKDEEYLGWREVAPAAEAARLERELRKQKPPEPDDRYRPPLPLAAQAFVLARYCAAHGEEALAVHLLRLSARTVADRSVPFAVNLQQDLRYLLAWNAFVDCRDPRIDRRQLAARFAAIHKLCPLAGPPVAPQFARMLDSLAAEDEAHAKVSPDAFAHLTPEAQARELVYQLRDESTTFDDLGSRPGAVAYQGNGAAERLTALGRPAVPALLEALEDRRPTRGLWSLRLWESIGVKPICDVAIEVVAKIAGLDFRWLIDSAEPVFSPEESSAAVALAREWGKAVAAGDELAWFRHRIETNSYGVEYCLRAVIQRYPNVAPAIVIRCLEAEKEPQRRSQLTRELWRWDNPEVTAFLIREMKGGPALGNRVAAAIPLRNRHVADAVPTMIAELRAADFSKWSGSTSDVPDDPVHVVSFLLGSNAVEAIDAIRETWPRFGRDAKTMVISQCHNRLNEHLGQIPPAEGQPNAAVRQALETLLLSTLGETAKPSWETSKDGAAPSIGERAAEVLAEFWPKKYHFELHAPAPQRAEQLKRMRTMADSAFR